MAGYVYIDNYSRKGKLAISTHVFDAIVEQALTHIPGISTSKKGFGKSFWFRLNQPVSTKITHGIVHVGVAVDIAKGKNIQETIAAIQNEVNSAILIATESVPFDVQVQIKSIL